MKGISQELAETIDLLFMARIRDCNGNYTEEERDKFTQQMIKGYKVGCLNFECQQIGISVLTQLTKVMRKHKKFHYFNFYGNNICDHGINNVFQLIQANKQITCLDVGCNNLTQQSQQTLFDIICETNIKSLQIGEKEEKWHANKFSVKFLSEMIDRLIKADRIECLGLNCLKLSSRDGSKTYTLADKLAEYVSKDDKLRTLCIANCGFNSADMVTFTTLGLLHNKFIRFLDMKNCVFDRLTGAQFMQNIYLMKNLQYLNISRCKLDKTAGVALSSSIKNGMKLIILDISNNNFDDEGASEIINSLVDCQTITEVNMCNTGFTSKCAEVLQELVMNNDILSYLDISKNFINNEGAFAIAKSLPFNDALNYLSLSSCHISDEGAYALSESLVKNMSITSFLIDDNFITRDCGYSMIENLRKNEIITYLNISASQVDHFIISAAEKLCRRNKQIKKDAKHLPLKQQLVALAIERTKMPEAEARLKYLKNAYYDYNNMIIDVKEEIHKTENEYNHKIDELKKSILNTKEMIIEEGKSIEKAKTEHERSVFNFELQYKDTVSKSDKLATDNVALEEKKNKIEQTTQEQSRKDAQEIEMLKKEIEEIKRMTEEALSIIDDPEKLDAYVIPDEYNEESYSSTYLIDEIEEKAKKEKSSKLGKTTKSRKLKQGKKSKK